MPEFPETLLALLGMSDGSYLEFNIPEQSYLHRKYAMCRWNVARNTGGKRSAGMGSRGTTTGTHSAGATGVRSKTGRNHQLRSRDFRGALPIQSHAAHRPRQAPRGPP